MRYHGKVGFTDTYDKGNGVWGSRIIEREYTGDIPQNTYHRDEHAKINDDIVSNNRISIVADDFAVRHYQFIKFAEMYGVPWEVTNVDISQLPRAILTLGNPYSGDREEAV